MIAAAILYSVSVALLLGLAALALERIHALRAWPRRPVWVIALVMSLVFPAAMLLATARVPQTQVVSADPLTIAVPATPDRPAHKAVLSVQLSRLAWPIRPDLDASLKGLWMATSAALLTFYGLAWLKLRQAARQWRRARLRDCSVWIAERVGPAVFGFFKPQVVLPRWLHDGPATTRSLVLAHEQEHIAARDQLLLLLALLLMLLTPWNLPLWWQLRRLRFAIEVDCDARVLSRGADSAAYAETLLAVGQHRSQMPLGAIALTEPVSQLERRIRIMMTRPRHSHVLLMGACLALSTSLVGTAAVLTAPEAVSTTAPRKLPPSSDREIGPRLEELLKEQFPELLRENTSGTAIVTVLFNSAGTVERTEKETLSGPPASFAPSEEHFRRVGLSPQEVAYVGVQAIKSPANNAEILVAFTERKRPNEYFVSKLFPDTRELDRAIVERYFPDALHGGVPAEARLWVLLDRSGQVLRTGREPFEASSLSDMLEERFVGIKTSEITVTPVTDQTSRPVSVRGGSGEMLQLHCVWLAVGSPPPDAAS